VVGVAGGLGGRREWALVGFWGFLGGEVFIISPETYKSYLMETGVNEQVSFLVGLEKYTKTSSHSWHVFPGFLLPYLRKETT